MLQKIQNHPNLNLYDIAGGSWMWIYKRGQHALNTLVLLLENRQIKE
ncbi:MAG: hypothetical protein KME46_32030 [Brasilonema angustatum HA4187-MV1]|jgi:hypothetical protein|nr:hypothetical protein [Brasilonema angustatum HA4187-MV1]